VEDDQRQWHWYRPRDIHHCVESKAETKFLLTKYIILLQMFKSWLCCFCCHRLLSMHPCEVHDFYARSHTREKRLFPSSCLSVRASVCVSAWISAAPTGQNSMKFDIGGRLWKSVKKVQICLKLGKNIGHFTRRPCYVMVVCFTK
jgi:hypothetical protein